MKRLVLLLLAVAVCLGMTACGPAGKVKLSQQFRSDEVEFIKHRGANTVWGSAYLKDRGDGPRTCAGNKVLLVPVTPYSSERMIAHYGNTRAGYTERNKSFENDDPFYLAYTRESVCDEKGRFLFKYVPDGDYFVTSLIVWSGYDPTWRTPITNGAALMRAVSVSGGKETNVTLTH